MRSKRSKIHKVRRLPLTRRPEVKYTTSLIQSDIAERATNSTALDISLYSKLNYFPSQGTTDSTRIGDSIYPVKIWVKFTLESKNTPASINVRVIIFSLPKDQSTSSSVLAFWQTSTVNQAINGCVNREVVYKVYYDKIFSIDQRVSGTNVCLRTRDINIRMKRPITFAAGSTDSKNRTDQLYIAYIGYNPGASLAETVVGYINCQTHFYYTD